MRLLFDANLSPSLAKGLHDIFPGSDHVFSYGIERDDLAIWEFAKANKFAIVSKDSDFQSRAALLGHPPKVICLQIGNCSTQEIELRLRISHKDIVEFARDPIQSIYFIRL